eukprot:COSAG01_NODE_66217_length_270_cov_3588.953216_1_plen_62_part_10
MAHILENMSCTPYSMTASDGILAENYYRQLIRFTISPDTSRPNSCHERTVRWNSLRLSGYAS